MQKLHFLIPTPSQTRAIVHEAREMGISDENIHVVATDRTLLEDLPEADVLEQSDFLPALKRGVSIGGVSGMLGGLVALALPSTGLVIGGGALLMGTLTGAGFGAWAASMIGSSVTNSELQQYQSALDRGELLVLLKLDTDDRISAIQEIAARHYPDVEIHQPAN